MSSLIGFHVSLVEKLRPRVTPENLENLKISPVTQASPYSGIDTDHT